MQEENYGKMRLDTGMKITSFIIDPHMRNIIIEEVCGFEPRGVHTPKKVPA